MESRWHKGGEDGQSADQRASCTSTTQPLTMHAARVLLLAALCCCLTSATAGRRDLTPAFRLFCNTRCVQPVPPAQLYVSRRRRRRCRHSADGPRTGCPLPASTFQRF